MNRRGFLKFLGAAAAGAAAAEIIPNGRVWFIPRKVELYTIEQYADYVNFSDLYLDPLNPQLLEIQRELCHRLGLTICAMMDIPERRDFFRSLNEKETTWQYGRA